MNLKLTLPIATLILAGCISTPQKQQIEKPNLQLSDYPTIYGYLEKVKENYEITKYSSVLPSTEEPWVKLNDLSAAFDTSPLKDYCSTDSLTGEKGNNTGLCDTDGPLFRKATVTFEEGAATAMGAVGTVLTFGMFAKIARGLYGTEFDQNAFDSAISDAYKSMDNLEVIFSKVKVLEQRKKQKYNVLRKRVKNKKSDIEKIVISEAVDKKNGRNRGKISIDTFKVLINGLPVNHPIAGEWKTIDELNQLEKKQLTKDENGVRFFLSCFHQLPKSKYTVNGCDKSWKLHDPLSEHKLLFSFDYAPIEKALKATKRAREKMSKKEWQALVERLKKVAKQ